MTTEEELREEIQRLEDKIRDMEEAHREEVNSFVEQLGEAAGALKEIRRLV